MKRRFYAGNIYHCNTKNIPECKGKYRFVIPTFDDNGQFFAVDCWIVDKSGNIHPGYNASPVPVNCENIGKILNAHHEIR